MIYITYVCVYNGNHGGGDNEADGNDDNNMNNDNGNNQIMTKV